MKMTPEKLKEVLDLHQKWLCGEDGGQRADLCGANLYRADLCGANLYRADLCGANLYRAYLRGAYLRGANLYGATLSKADLRGADLRGADLRGADLRGADLYEADLSGAKIEDKLLNRFFPIACPETGSFIGYKKARGFIVRLEILADAKRSSAFGRKCRCSAAKCLAIEKNDGTDSGLTAVESGYDGSFVYTVGEVVSVDDFDEDRKNECAPGIHFFITRQEAVDY